MTPLKDAETLTAVGVVTAAVFIAKVDVVLPAATVALAGTVATAMLLLESAMVAPLLGAGALKLTVPVDGDPPTTLTGFRVTEERAGLDCTGVAVVPLLPAPPQETSVNPTASIPSAAGS